MLTTVLSVGLGLAFLFLVLALFTSAVNEGVASLTKRRGVFLRRGIANLLADPSSAEPIVDRVYDHGLIKALGRAPGVLGLPFRRRFRPPSYIPAGTFVAALFDSYQPEAAADDWTWRNDVAGVIDRLPHADLRQSLRALWRDANGEVDRFRLKVEGWYDDAMGRVSGWYTRRTQLWLWVIGAVLVVVLNADAVMVGRALWQDPTLREAVAEQASTLAEEEDLEAVAERVSDVEALAIPLGWGDDPRDLRDAPSDPAGWALKVVGWALTVGAVSLGAPFWFDVLGRVARVRQSGGPPPAHPTAAPPGATPAG